MQFWVWDFRANENMRSILFLGAIPGTLLKDYMLVKQRDK